MDPETPAEHEDGHEAEGAIVSISLGAYLDTTPTLFRAPNSPTSCFMVGGTVNVQIHSVSKGDVRGTVTLADPITRLACVEFKGPDGTGHYRKWVSFDDARPRIQTAGTSPDTLLSSVMASGIAGNAREQMSQVTSQEKQPISVVTKGEPTPYREPGRDEVLVYELALQPSVTIYSTSRGKHMQAVADLVTQDLCWCRVRYDGSHKWVRVEKTDPPLSVRKGTH